MMEFFQALYLSWFGPVWGPQLFTFVKTLLLIIVILMPLMLSVAYLTLAERKIIGYMQIRIGPNRVGPKGWLQPIADALKLMFKEIIIPSGANKFLFLLAPVLVLGPALAAWAVIPFTPELVLANVDASLLYIMAITSMGVYGVVIAGWASNSKYSLLGGIRGAAQMISYELPLVLSLVPVVMLAGSFSLVDIVNAQSRYPFILVQPVSFVIFFLSAAAEIKRIPFDLPEAENELVAGYHTEYSGMRFGLYFLGEYISLVVLGSMVAVFFWGGWRGPFLPPLVWFIIKVWIIIFIMIWMRGTLPRLRYDQLMHVTGKVLIPVALLNIIVSGAVMLGRG